MNLQAKEPNFKQS